MSRVPIAATSRACGVTSLLYALALILLSSATAHAGEVAVFPNDTFRSVGVRSIEELKFYGAVAQQYDFSCGAAAVATLLSHHYGKKTSEAQVFKQMWANGDREKIKRRGFSLLDMKSFLVSQGFRADGFRLPLGKIHKAGIPAIALIEVDDYKHFVVIKGMSESEVLVGDPTLGVRVMPRNEFDQLRDDVVLIVRNHVQVARAGFNVERDWQLRPRPPVRVAVGRDGLASFTMLLPQRNEF